MALHRMNPGQYSEHNILSGTSTGETLDFGINANYLRFTNRGSFGTVYYKLGATSDDPATTSGGVLTTGDVFDANVPLTRQIGFATGSTSTSTGDGIGIDLVALSG